jgi:hypothetical protein
MKFDNSRTIISIRIRLFAYTVIFLAFLVLTHVAKIIEYPVLGLSEKTWTIIFTIIYVFLVFLPMVLSYQYIFFSDEGEYIILRYFSAGIVGGRKNSVEIEKRTFSGYRIDNHLFGLSKSITLFQKLNNGVAKYPPVYISALKKEQREKLVRSLNLQMPK